jgi:hypothetical protein
MSVDRMMESDVAKPFRMLSAYLMTAAMTNPPRAWKHTKGHGFDGRHNTHNQSHIKIHTNT